MHPKNNSSQGIPPDLKGRIQNAFERCPQFKTDAALRSLFTDGRIAPWRNLCPNAPNTASRIALTIECLYDQNTDHSDNALVLLLKVMSENCEEGNSLRRELADLANELEAFTNPEKKSCELALASIPVMISIPAGPFWIGSTPKDSNARPNEKPGRKVSTEAYQIGRYPITRYQYAQFITDSGHAPPPDWARANSSEQKKDHPVVNISYGDAIAYCNWLREKTGKYYSLPTEEQWEKAAQGAWPNRQIYPWGNKWNSSFCNTSEVEPQDTVPVYAHETYNISPFKVIDMAGNVWEWTNSWYTRYPESPYESLRYGKIYRVVRGGGWSNTRQEARISCRGRYKPETRRPYLGFRVVTF